MSIGVLDTTTRQVHCFLLKRGGEDVSVKEFVSRVEAKLSELTGAGTCSRVLCAAVGDACINICDRLRTVQYYLLDGKPWFIKTGVFPSSHVDVHIKEIHMEYGNEAAIKIDLDKSRVKDLKQKFAKMTCTFFPNLHLVFGKKELENDKRLSDYNLTGGCVVPCMSGDRKLSLGTSYMHIPEAEENGHTTLRNSREESCTSHHQSDEEQQRFPNHAPVWRRAAPGLWLEGRCSNEICVAYSKLVVMNQGFTHLDFVNERHSCKCPMCYERVSPTAYGINRCEWTTVGLKKSHPSQVVRQDWQTLEEGHVRFVPDTDSWARLKVTSRQLNGHLKFCVLCMSRCVSEMAPTECGHMFHVKCLKAGTDCLQCIGERNMTVYQNHFLN